MANEKWAPAAGDSIPTLQERIAYGTAAIASRGYCSTVTITRPSNTTAYDAGDVIGIADAGTAANAGSAILTFANIGPGTGLVRVTDLMLEYYVNAVPSGLTTCKLALYNAAPAAILDNAAWDLAEANRTKYLGTIAIAQIVDIGSSLAIEVTGGTKTVLPVGTSLYANLITVGGFTPASAGVFKITLCTQAV